MNKKILIIEDDTALFQIYKDLFEARDLVVIGAETGAAGLELVKYAKPDLIILDIMLPGGMNGFDVLEGIEADTAAREIPVIVLTNLDSEEKVAKIIGAKKYLVKANTTTDEVIKSAMEYLS